MKRKIAVMLALLCVMAAGCGKEKQEQQEIAFTINGEEISLREWNFYIRMNQMQWEKSYLEEYGDEMWDRQMKQDGKTLRDYLEESVFNIILETHVANQHAAEYGTVLPEETLQEVEERAVSFMETYAEPLLQFAGADEEYVKGLLTQTELCYAVAEDAVADYEPEIPEEAYHREGICYVLISTTGRRDSEGNLTPFTEEERQMRTEKAFELSEKAKESRELKKEAEALKLTAIESSMGNSNEGDGQEPLMLDAARALAVGEVSDPIEVEEGWFVVQHTSDYDEEGVEYWKEHLKHQAKEERYRELLEEWKNTADIRKNEEIMEKVMVKKVLKELL